MADQYTNDITTTGVLTIGTPITSAIDTAGDADWFRITLEAGKSYGITTGIDRDFDSRITGIYDATGTAMTGLLRNANEFEEKSPWPEHRHGVFYEAQASGDYFVSVASESAGETGAYTVELFEDALPGDASTTGQVLVNQTVFGTLEARMDEDWFAVDLESGKHYYAELLGAGSNGNTAQYTRLEWFDAAGNAIRESGLGTSPVNGHVWMAPTTDGTSYLSVSGEHLGVGTYSIDLLEYIPEPIGGRDEDEILGDLGVDEVLYSTMDGSLDTDGFRTTLEAGTSYYVEMDGSVTPRNGEHQAGLALQDAGGAELASSGAPLDADHLTAGMVFTAGTDGSYFVIAGDGNPDTAVGGLYSLSLTELPNLSFTAGSDWLTLPPDVLPRLLDIKGGAGNDMMSFSGHGTGVEVNLATGLARAGGADAFSILMDGVEGITGTSQNDTLYGSDGNDKMRGLGGRDVIFGSGGARDTIDGGASVDTLDYIGAGAGVSVSLLKGRGWGGDAAGDRISGVENVSGSTHDDFIWGDHGANRLEGSHGDDTLVGNGGDDYILAGLGNDVVVFSGNRADYTITQNGIRTDVIDNVGGDGHDILGHAEVLRFTDGDFIL